MDAIHFDALAKSLITPASRRGALLGLVAAVFAPFLPDPEAEAGRRKRHKKANPCSALGGKCAFKGDCCASGTRCKNHPVIGGQCRCQRNRAPCQAQGTCCPVGQVCCGRCADLKTNPDHCGACAAACGVGETCVGGVCTG